MISLPATGVVPYLLQHGFIAPDELRPGGLQVREVHRRNRNFRIQRRNRPGLFLKQAAAAGASRGIEAEAGVCSLKDRPNSPSALHSLPTLRHYDRDQAILVMELLPGPSLARRRSRTGVPSARKCQTLGKAFSAIHQVTKDEGHAGWMLLETRPPDLIESLLWPRVGSFGQLSGGQIEYIRLLQGHVELSRALSAAGDAWCGSSFVHMDFRWDNAIDEESTVESASIRLVDWETGGWGDPAWDVGCVFAAFLSDWLFSIAESASAAPDKTLSAARYPLHRMQPAIRGFWGAYVRGRTLGEGDAARLLLRSTRMCAVRLCQSAFEALLNHDRTNAGSYRLTQVALNMLLRTREAAVHLLGLPAVDSDEV